ncbi:hypothetical protein F8388_005181 [Cannabis sativa]|uniref:Tetratricopeptide repeat protein 38 n=1 Tax=Cannabis sativa TaxID=3483 RepID=A0A7J6EEL2_CANSA|nr:hypothetical protein F8388_005181 [Cannabis sativa]
MEGGVKRDRWGYEVRTPSDACISAINHYYHQVLIYGRERSVILKATLHDQDCVLANILAAHYLSSSDPSQAHFYLHAAVSRLEQATSYEKAVFDAVHSLISDNRDDEFALEMHFKLLKDFPKDLSSLKRAQVICFYMGRADTSLTLVQQVLPQNQLENYIYGMLAFPLLELGQMEEAEKAARKALEINKDDCWAQHNAKEAYHIFSYSTWITHNWWHVALCYMEGHSPIQKIVKVYDQHIWKELERADASPVERNWFMEWHFDVLILWALPYSNEHSKAEDLLKGLRSRFFKMNSKKQQLMQRGMSLAEAMYEYGRGNYKQALEFLEPDFDAVDYKIIGASDEQVDVFNEVWYSMLLNTGQALKVIEVLGERIKKREGVPFLWRLLERAYTIVGSKEAPIVGEKAKVLETAYFK